MDHEQLDDVLCCCCRRGFLQAMGAGGLALLGASAVPASPDPQASAPKKRTPTVRGAFLYPPSERLKQEGYWSWPGSNFDAEGRQRTYMAQIAAMEKRLGMRIAMEAAALDTPADAARFIAELKQSPPDGLLLIPLKKGHWDLVLKIIDETKLPTVVLATLGVLLSDHIRTLHTRPGVYLISAGDDFNAVEWGMKMIRTARWMKDARLVNISGKEYREATVPNWGSQLRYVPHARFVEVFNQTKPDGPVAELAKAYRAGAKAIVEPSEADIVESARAALTLKRIVEEEHGDAAMMDCLPGLRIPHKHCPPCMGFMTLRDAGLPIGCQADLSATLSLMLGQQLFGRPGFQQNSAMDTEQNLYFGSHCTAPSKMLGPTGPAEPYELRSHAEAGWGCVPRVLFKQGQEMTILQYQPGEKPQMFIYTGQVVECPPIPPTGGCRTNVKLTINEVRDVCDVQGMHQAIFYGNYARQLRSFCQLYEIEAVS